MTFLGQEIAATAEFAAALNGAQDALQATFDNLPEEDHLGFFSSQPTDSVAVWCGINEPLLGHSDLKAVDINVSTNPYIATRTGDVFGGEGAIPQLQSVRQDAIAACDRATQFFRGTGKFADLAARRPC